MAASLAAYVKIWDVTAGAVAWDPDQQLAFFEFTKEFENSGWDIAPIKMPVGQQHTIYSFPELRKGRGVEFDTFKGLPGLLADVLPDKYGNQIIKAWLARQGRPEDSMNPVEHLCFIGSRGVGALEFEPSQTPKAKNSFALEINSLVETAAHLLNDKLEFKTNIQEDELKAMTEILRVGTSAGGARPKAVIAFNSKTGDVRSGQTRAPKGYEHWIIKLDGVSNVQFGESSGYGRVEQAYYLMARDCGIQMMESRLLEENGRAHFMTRRFDRAEGNVRHHVQSLCALQHYDFNDMFSFSYEQLFQTARRLHLPYQDMQQLYRTMVFNVMARNCDDHTKNFSFILEKDKAWRLSPAYDLCHAYRPESRWVSQHALSVNGQRNNINLHDLMAVARNANIKRPEAIIDNVKEVVSNWNKYANDVGVNPSLRDSIANTLLV